MSWKCDNCETSNTELLARCIECGEMRSESAASPAGYGGLTVGSLMCRLSREDIADNGLCTEVKLYSDGSWSVVRESDDTEIACGDNIISLAAWAAHTP